MLGDWIFVVYRGAERPGHSGYPDGTVPAVFAADPSRYLLIPV